jgi:hypothetical protein
MLVHCAANNTQLAVLVGRLPEPQPATPWSALAGSGDPARRGPAHLSSTSFRVADDVDLLVRVTS